MNKLPSVAKMLNDAQRENHWMFQERGLVISPLNGNDDSEFSLIDMEDGPDERTRHQTLVKVGRELKDYGFTVSFYNFQGTMPGRTDGPELIHYLHVSIIRAESKLFWSAGNSLRNRKASPNFDGLIATGPLIRSEGMQPRRIVLSYNQHGVQPWVTHVQCIPDGNGSLNYPFLDGGHYWSTYAKAVSEFTERVIAFDKDWNPEEWG